MLLQAIALDAAMSVSSSLARLARYGLWLDPDEPEAKAWITENANLLKISVHEAARRLSRNPRGYSAAIRRQWYASVLWYSRQAEDVLDSCARAHPEDSLLNALELNEPDSRLPIELLAKGEIPQQEGVMLDGNTPVAVSMLQKLAMFDDAGSSKSAKLDDFALASDHIIVRDGIGPVRGPIPPSSPPPQDVRAWPRLDAPEYIPALTPFEVTVGLAATQQAGVAGGQMILPVPAGVTTIEITIELIADGVDALDGWTRSLHVNVHDPMSAEVTFLLTGRNPSGPEPVHLTTIEVRYVLKGAVCGTASRPLVIGKPSVSKLNTLPTNYGTPWLSQRSTSTPIDLRVDEHAADLTIELSKPDGNSASGHFVCRLRSPHSIYLDAGPHDVNLGHDAKAFAKTTIDIVREFSRDPLVDNALNSVGDLVAEKLPAAVFNALREVATLVAPAPPAVLIVSAEPYVPWELARIEPPLDPSRPPYLGAQVLIGRWWRETAGGPSRSDTGVEQVPLRIEKPPSEPPASITVRHMAVMAGMYKTESGLRKLPAAEDEAAILVKSYHAIPLAASTQALKQLLDARLEYGFEEIGWAGAVHFAGHGAYEPDRPDASVLFLSDGKPVSALLFRSAKYGGDRQPLIFLNACMIGIGGELLGNMGGFPGNCLRGGFGGVLGALWEIDDTVAKQFATEFWQRAMPPDGGNGEPVAAILRDLRAKYVVKETEIPQATYLSYVYYGHPRLMLQRTT